MLSASPVVLFRVDASEALGTGHLTRCVTLARSLRAHGASVVFACGGDVRTCESLLAHTGFDMRPVPPALTQDDDAKAITGMMGTLHRVDVVVVDHYSLGAQWETAMSSLAPVVVIDDLADRPHECRVLLDQNLYRDPDFRYSGLVPADCRLLLGPRFALLRGEFERAGESVPVRDGRIRSVLVSYGGSDPTHEMLKALDGLARLSPIERIDVTIGPAMQRTEAIHRAARTDQRIQLHHSPPDMAALMLNADLSLGAGGSTNWERCLLGLPSIVTSVAANQVEAAITLADTSAVLYAGDSRSVTAECLTRLVGELLSDPRRVATMSARARAVMADHTGADHVASVILEVANARS